MQVEHVVLEGNSHIVSAEDGRRILHVAFHGKHHYSHGTQMVTQLAEAVAAARPSGVLVDHLQYDYEFGNDVCGLFFAGRHKESGTIVPTCIVAIGTRAGMESLYSAGTFKLERYLGFAASVAEGMTWLCPTPASWQWSRELIPDWSKLISLPAWMPLSDYGSPLISISDRLHEVGTSAFLLTATHDLDDRPFALGPRIVLVHWAPSRGAAQRIFGRPEDDDGAGGTPPAELIPAGAVPQYGSIFAVLRSGGVSGFRAGSYRTAQDGKVIYRFMGTPRVSFYFRSPGDDDSEPPFGVSVPLYSREDAPMGSWAQVKALIGRLVDAWNRGDADGFASTFAPHAEYVTGQGQRIWGRGGIAELVRQAGPGSQVVVLSGPSVECDGNAGKARFSWATADQGTAARQGVTTCTLIREDTRWMIETLRTEERRHHE